MHIDPAGRAGLSQRGSNSKMRARESRRSELQTEEGGGFSKEEKEKMRRGGKANEKKGEVGDGT